MLLSGNTVLVTGGGSGIGRGLAVALHGAGNRVIVAGRRPAPLRAVADSHPGIECLLLDVCDPASMRHLVDRVDHDFPDLNIVINNAAAMAIEDAMTPDPVTAATIVSTNLLGPITLTSLLMPRLLGRQRGAIINVTSALAFVPLAAAPTYCATKAGLHSYTESLRHQLRKSQIQVIEIAPPRVRTDMTGPADERAIDVDEFVEQVMSALRSRPEDTEIIVDASRKLRYAERIGTYAEQFAVINQRYETTELEELS